MTANQEIIAELRRVLNERDEAQARVVDAALIHAELVRERDEARREVARLKSRPTEAEIGRLDVMWQQLVRERDEARAEVERLRTALLEVQTSESAPAWFADGFHEGWKAGAEAMREACADMVRSEMTTGLLTPANVAQVVKMLATMPIPEEP